MGHSVSIKTTQMWCYRESIHRQCKQMNRLYSNKALFTKVGCRLDLPMSHSLPTPVLYLYFFLFTKGFTTAHERSFSLAGNGYYSCTHVQTALRRKRLLGMAFNLQPFLCLSNQFSVLGLKPWVPVSHFFPEKTMHFCY